MEALDNTTQQFVAAFGGDIAAAIEAVLHFSRVLWDLTLAPPGVAHNLPEVSKQDYHLIDLSDLRSKCHQFPGDAIDLLLKSMEAAKLCHQRTDNRLVALLRAYEPLTLVRTLFYGYRPDHDLRYFTMMAVRRESKLVLSSTTARCFHLLANHLSRITSARRKEMRNVSRGTLLHYQADLRQPLSALLQGPVDQLCSDSLLRAFLDACRLASYLQIARQSGHVVINSARIDAEYMLSNLFGMTTGPTGLDDLFGGGGIMLPDDYAPTGAPHLAGRTVLTVGRFGTGKSLLALQMSLEVARKGGLVWVMALEQSAEECLYALESIGHSPDPKLVETITDSRAAARFLSEAIPGRGALIFLGKEVKESRDLFHTALLANARLMAEHRSKFPLRLIVVDPITAIPASPKLRIQNRTDALKTLDAITNEGTNIWLVGESGNHGDDLQYEQNIADTVIELTSERILDYSQRFIEVTKSRLQREQRGRHPFSIRSQLGFNVSPSPSAVSARIRSRSLPFGSQSVPFGLKSLDDILGLDAIRAGDVVVLQGPEESLKTLLGLHFLFCSDKPTQQKSHKRLGSLWVNALGDDTTWREYLQRNHTFVGNSSVKKPDDVSVLALSRGYIQPGYVLKLIEQELLAAKLAGQTIDRVMTDNISHWELSCPYIRGDATLGDTLVDLLRRQGVTSLFACSDAPPYGASVVQKQIIDNADCLISLSIIEYRGASKITVRVKRTKSMKHRLEVFELALEGGRLKVKPTSSLLRVMPDGQVLPVTIRLFLHAESMMQRRYNERFLDAIKAALSTHAFIEPQAGMFLGQALTLGSSSTVDELQLLQLDEFQIPSPTAGGKSSPVLHGYEPHELQDEDIEHLRGFFPEYSKRMRRHGRFLAFPYYANVSLLAYRRDVVSSRVDLNSWAGLLEEQNRWQEARGRVGDGVENEDTVFFDFVAETDENFNCLFFEILTSLTDFPMGIGNCSLRQWLRSDYAKTAAGIYRKLCRPAYLKKRRAADIDNEKGNGFRSVTVMTNAVVWRHWYTTLNQMLAGMSQEERGGIEVTYLPKLKSVAGEWYIGISTYSAAVDVGLSLIRMLTSREAELDRLMSGVGLPTRLAFYEKGSSTQRLDTFVSPFFSLQTESLAEVIQKSFRRSAFGCYRSLSGVLASHLRRIIEIPDGKEDGMIAMLFDSLVNRVASLETREVCETCDPNGSRLASKGALVGIDIAPGQNEPY
jgi:KaiC/GvpD/RAD55 family RecA-like ATPase